MKTTSGGVPFNVESIMYLDRKQLNRVLTGYLAANTYLVLSQDYGCKAKEDMEITVRGAMAPEGGREFKEVNECANSQL